MNSKRIYIIGNWKCNKNSQEVNTWFHAIGNIKTPHEIVVCPTYIHLIQAKNLINSLKLTLKLGAQDVSPFPNGAYTGEVSASQLKEMVEYLIIGHSERRKNFNESDELLAQKVKQANDQSLKTIFCVPDENTAIPQGVSIVAYEPVWAIGSGKADSPENANTVIEKIKEKYPNVPVIYGGSVTPENIQSYLSEEYIDGVLPGGASLDAIKFAQMVNASNAL